MIQRSLLMLVSPPLPSLSVSLSLQTCDEFADNTAPHSPVLFLMKTVVIYVALATAGVVGVCLQVYVCVFFLSLQFYSNQEMSRG